MTYFYFYASFNIKKTVCTICRFIQYAHRCLCFYLHKQKILKSFLKGTWTTSTRYCWHDLASFTKYWTWEELLPLHHVEMTIDDSKICLLHPWSKSIDEVRHYLSADSSHIWKFVLRYKDKRIQCDGCRRVSGVFMRHWLFYQLFGFVQLPLISCLTQLTCQLHI